jgi:RNA polymerase sigma factor (TIGR02999 family)
VDPADSVAALAGADAEFIGLGQSFNSHSSLDKSENPRKSASSSRELSGLFQNYDAYCYYRIMDQYPSLEDLLASWKAGDLASVDAVVTQLYEVLRLRVRRALRGERNRDILETTDLLHDLYLKLREIKTPPDQGPEHFLRTAARIVRNTLIDRARKFQSLKGGENPRFVTLSNVDLSPENGEEARLIDVVMVHEALQRIQRFDPGMATHIELRLFLDMTQNEIAEALGTNRTSVQREWILARRVLLRELGALPAEVSPDG